MWKISLVTFRRHSLTIQKFNVKWSIELVWIENNRTGPLNKYTCWNYLFMHTKFLYEFKKKVGLVFFSFYFLSCRASLKNTFTKYSWMFQIKSLLLKIRIVITLNSCSECLILWTIRNKIITEFLFYNS